MREAIIAETLRWLGTPYQHQASLKGAGCDCLGLIRGVWRGVYGSEPETPPAYSPDWAEARGAETLVAAAARHLLPVAVAAAQPGDVLLFRWRANLPAKHAGVLVGDDTFVHAQQGAVVARAAYAPWWRRRTAFAFRFPGVKT